MRQDGVRSDASTTLREPALLRARESWFRRLRGLFAGSVQEPPFFLHGVLRYTEDDGPDWESWLDESLDQLAAEAHRSLDSSCFRPLVLNYNPHGVHFIDLLFGAELFRRGGGWQARVLDSPVGTLEPPDLERLPAWRLMTRFTEAFLERQVPAVLFGLPTVASTLNIAVNLYGQEILLAMLAEAEAARHDLEVINDLLCRIHRWYLRHVPQDQMQCILANGRCQPPGYGQLCGCTTQLISREQYAEFIAPLDDALLSLYPHGGMIHLCGSHTQHIPTWRAMSSLRSIQVNDRAAHDLRSYFQELRQDQVIYVDPCEEMPIDHILEITGGRRVVVVADRTQAPLDV